MQKPQVDHIEIRGARVHNLKNVDLDIPLRKLICFAGPSGSGKTSLAFHTLLTESKRRFVNSFPNSMKFFTDRPAAVDVDRIFPVLPVFGLPQINPVVGSRSVVSDIMRLTDSLQNFFFTAAKERCPVHHEDLSTRSISSQLKGQVKNIEAGGIYHLLLPPGDFVRVFGEGFIPPRSYSSARKTIEPFNETDEMWEVLRFKFENLDAFEKKWTELKLEKFAIDYMLWGPGFKKPSVLKFHFKKVCPKCDFEANPVQTVSAFSPYSALGACPSCNGYGANLVYDEKKLIDRELSIEEGGLKLLNYGPFQGELEALLKILKKKKIPTDVPIRKLPKDFFDILENGEGSYYGFKELKNYLQSKKYKPSVRIYIRNLQKEEACHDCSCTRINPAVHYYKISIGDKWVSISDVMSLTIQEALDLFRMKKASRDAHEARILNDIVETLRLAQNMGLGHLKLLRKAKSLSAGEYQRLLLIKYLSFRGTDSLFVLDEPSLGLSENELSQLVTSVRHIIDQGNTVIVIDHSEYIQKNSDYLIQMGPGAGKAGGEVIFQGAPDTYFKKAKPIVWNKKEIQSRKAGFIEVTSPNIYSKSYPDFKVPLEQMVWITGDSGTGKTANIVKIMANTLHKKLFSEWLEDDEFSVKSVVSSQKFEDVIVVSSDLNRFTSRSTVGTVTEFASVIRKHFLKLPIAKSMGLKEGHLSSNSELGMCMRCEGRGSLIIEMQYLEDIVLECEDCKGLKIKPLYANISDGTMTVAEAYNLPLNQVLERIELTPKFQRIWDYLKILNLDYLSLDRQLNSLSGGEKQRIYLLSKLVKTIQNSLVIFENLSFGLSERELRMLGEFLQELLYLKNTILIIDSSSCFRYLATSRLHFQHGKIDLIKP